MRVLIYFKTMSNFISHLKVCIFRLVPFKKYGRFTCYIQSFYKQVDLSTTTFSLVVLLEKVPCHLAPIS